MLRVVQGGVSVERWALFKLPWIGDFGKCISLGIVRDSKLIAAAIYNNYVHYDCQLTFVSDDPRWASRQVVRQVLGFPFYELGTFRITTLTDANNHKALKLNEKLGFVREGVMRKASPMGNGNDGVICGLTKEDFEEGVYSGQVSTRQSRPSGFD